MVIIEVKNLQNNDLIGKLVLSKAGRDKNHLYVIIKVIDSNYVFIANGSTKTLDKPKKKKLKHLMLLESVNNDLKLAIINNESANLQIKRFLKLRGIVKEG
jgi:ribosomal protein L14E/L6E/L27E